MYSISILPDPDSLGTDYFYESYFPLFSHYCQMASVAELIAFSAEGTTVEAGGVVQGSLPERRALTLLPSNRWQSQPRRLFQGLHKNLLFFFWHWLSFPISPTRRGHFGVEGIGRDYVTYPLSFCRRGKFNYWVCNFQGLKLPPCLSGSM